MSWPTERLADVCQLRPPKAEARKRLKPNDEVSFVPMNNLAVSEMSFVAKETRALSEVDGSYTYFADGDVLLAKITPCFENGKLGVAQGLKNGIGFGSSEYFVIRPSQRLLPQFLYYFFAQQSFRDEGASVMTGAVGHRRVPKSFIEDYPIPVPPLDEQEKIVAILDETFEGCAKVTSKVERNMGKAMELFNAVLDGRFTDQTDWNAFFLGDEVRFIDYRGKTPPKRSEGVRLITAKNVKMGYVRRTPEEFVDPDCYEGWMTRGFPKSGDVLFTMEAPLGNVALLDTNETVVVGQRLITMQTDEDRLSSEFLKWLLMSPGVQSEIKSKATGATVQGIKAKLLKRIELAAPSVSEQSNICRDLQAAWDWVEALTEKYEKKSEALVELRQSTLQKAFAGDLASMSKQKPHIVFSHDPATTTSEFAAHVLAFAYARHASNSRDKTFGRVKAQKTLHLVESLGGVDLGRVPIKDAAGPNDSAHMRRAEDWAAKNKYFEFVSRGKGYDFKKLKNFRNLVADTRTKFGSRKSKIEQVIDLLVPMNSRDAEVFATVHAAWNNLVVDMVEATDEAVLREARDNWHESKLGIPEKEFRKAIRFIRSNDLVPDGTARPVRGQETLF